MSDGASEQGLAALVRSASLGPLCVGKAVGEVEAVLGAPEETSQIARGLEIRSYAKRVLQLTYRDDRLALLAVYLPFPSGSIVVGPLRIVDDLPGEPASGIAAYRAWVGGEAQVLSDERDGGVVRAANGVSAVFEERGLVSLQVTGRIPGSPDPGLQGTPDRG